MTNDVLGNEQIAHLRQNNLLGKSEIAYVAGDLIVAENIETGEKRVVGEVATIHTESSRRVLKG